MKQTMTKVLFLAMILAGSVQAETPTETTALEPQSRTVTITREELGAPPPPAYGGDLDKINTMGEYENCVAKVIETIPASVSALERQVLMSQAQKSCNDRIEAWNNIETAKYRAQAAEASRPRWWHRLIPSADAVLQVGAGVWMNTTNQKYGYRRDREMWEAVREIGGSQPGNVEINGAEGEINYNQGSPGSFSNGDFTQGLGDDSFNTDTRTNTDTRSNTDNVTFD